MEWHAEAIVLSVRPHGETSAIVSVMTRDHGRYAGLVRGARSRTLRAALQPGNRVKGHWRARLSEHLGTLTVEPTRARVALVIGDPLRLAATNAALALVETAIAERDPHTALYDGLSAILEIIAEDENTQTPLDWLTAYVAFERGLLHDMGFALALEECAVTGVKTALTHVSPKTGRAVCEAEARPYKAKLLELPTFLATASAPDEMKDIRQALDLTGFFLNKIVYAPHGSEPPEARARFYDRVRKTAESASASPKNQL